MGNLTDTVDLVTSRRLSTVVPGRLTEDDTMHELQDIDLAMKLHYINCLYFFEPIISDDKNVGTEFVNISQLKLPMFSLLSAYNQVSGRMRGGDHGERPYIKCNDCGVRIVEARCGLTVEDVIQMDDYQSVFDGLVYKMVLGPDLGFSPLVIFQFTWFKCGGFAVGLRWAHILGDAFSASVFINRWAKLYSNDSTSPISIKGPNQDEAHLKAPVARPATTKHISFAKRVNPVGNHWVVNSNVKQKTHIFRIGAKQFSQIRSNTCGYGAEFPPFEILSAIFWKSIAKLRRNGDELEPSSVTVCRRNSKFDANQALSNSQVISTVETNLNVADAKVEDLVKLIFNAKTDEKRLIKDEDLESDFMVYGANLTFVDLGEMRLYDMKLNGKRPVSAVCSMDGIGEEGLVLVAPDNDEDGGDGRIVIVTFDEEKFVEMETDIKQTWGIA